MSSKERTEVQKRFEHIPGMNCFVCAPERLNSSGLKLVFEETATGARTGFSPSKVFQSYPGFLHGGILCAILDETMAYAGVFKRHVLPFTKTIEVRFRAAVPADRAHQCESILGENNEDGFRAEATIQDEKGRILVSATAEFVIPSLRMAQKMMPEVDLDGFESFFPPSRR